MQRNFLVLYALLISISLCATGCEKFSPSSRLVNSWKLEKILKNGDDITSQLLITDYREQFDDDEFYGYAYSFVDQNGNPVSRELSTYTLNEEEKTLSLYNSLEIPLTNEDTISLYRSCQITKISGRKLQYEFDWQGDSFEFQFVSD